MNKLSNLVYYKTTQEIEAVRESALLVSRTLGLVASEIREGITTAYLDKIAEEFIKDHQARPAFKGYHNGRTPFPASLCISLNDQVVHGIPSNREIKDGDVVSVDCGVEKNGFYGDHAYTFAVGNVKSDALKLLKVTKECLYLGIEQTCVGKRIGDISYVIQQHAQKNGFSVVRELVGHGLGRSLHEAPEVPNYGKRGSGRPIQNGLIIAIEPMINMGKKDVREWTDTWTISTIDGLPSAHFEHDVAVVNGKPEVLSTFTYVEEAIQKNNNLVFI